MQHSSKSIYVYGIVVIAFVLASIFLLPLRDQLMNENNRTSQVIDLEETDEVTPQAPRDTTPVPSETPAQTPSTPVIPTQNTPTSSSKMIEEAKAFYSVRLPTLISVYMIQKSPIQANEAAWSAFINHNDGSAIDPQTGEVPRFTTQTPLIGEVQYRYPARCANALEFSDSSSSNDYAFKTRIGDKYACISRIGKYIEK